MQPINFSLGYDSNGTFRVKLLYSRLYKCLPNILIYQFGEVKPNFDKIDYDDIQKKFPDAVIQYNMWKDNFKTSCVDGEMDYDDEDDGEIITPAGWVGSDFYIFTDGLFANIEPRSITILFNNNKGAAEKFLNDIIAAVPIDEPEPSPSKIQLICRDSEYYTIESEIKKVNLDIDKCFNDDFKPYYEKLVNFLKPENKESGVVVFSGPPGTLKTSMIRHLVGAVANRYIYINPSMASNLTDSAFTSFLLNHKNSVFILEDCEEVVMDREDSSIGNAVASLLNMSDGLMSDVFNGKFICTFNTDLSSVDKALLRKGRCKVKYVFDKLCKEKTQALLIENGVSPEEASKAGPMIAADIFNYGDDTGVEDKTTKLGF